jgi:signal transduction protein with GAF and PtsI domain
VGLFRTEIPFLIRERFPTEEEQRLIYREQLEAFAPRPVTMRTLDIGGDKALPYFPIEEENPFLGWRGIRVTLDHPEIYLAQVRAMLKANSGLGNLRVMLPMISNVSEFDEARALLVRAYSEVLEEGWAVRMPQVGVMIEVPAAVYQAGVLARRADFLSVGTNDLTQYLLAVDRNNARVANLYHAFHPAVLHALMDVVETVQLLDPEGDGLHEFWQTPLNHSRIINSFDLIGSTSMVDVLNASQWCQTRNADRDEYSETEADYLASIEEDLYQALGELPDLVEEFVEDELSS